MPHPLLRVRPLGPPFLQMGSRRLEIRLLKRTKNPTVNVSRPFCSPKGRIHHHPILGNLKTGTYLHVADEQAKEHHTQNGHHNGEAYLPDVIAGDEILTQGASRRQIEIISFQGEPGFSVSAIERRQSVPEVPQAPPEAEEVLLEEGGRGDAGADSVGIYPKLIEGVAWIA